MKLELTKINELSGEEASIYTLYSYDFETTLFDRFLHENSSQYPDDIADILDRLETIGHDTGARSNFFKDAEGSPGDGVCVLKFRPRKKLRLFCIKFGMDLIIIGGGGTKDVRAWQDDPKLSEEANLMKTISKEISNRQNNTSFEEIRLINDGKDFEGDLIFEV